MHLRAAGSGMGGQRLQTVTVLTSVPDLGGVFFPQSPCRYIYPRSRMTFIWHLRNLYLASLSKLRQRIMTSILKITHCSCTHTCNVVLQPCAPPFCTVPAPRSKATWSRCTTCASASWWTSGRAAAGSARCGGRWQTWRRSWRSGRAGGRQGRRTGSREAGTRRGGRGLGTQRRGGRGLGMQRRGSRAPWL